MVGAVDDQLSQVRASLTETMNQKNVITQWILSRDGIDAIGKVDNQKFDAMIIDAEAPRVLNADFLNGIGRHRNTNDCNIFVMSTQDQEQLHPNLQKYAFLQKPLQTEILLQGLSEALSQNLKPSMVEKFSVDVRVINALIKATMMVCQNYGLDQVDMEKPTPKLLELPWQGQSGAYLDIRSQVFSGGLILSFEKNVFLKIVSEMLGEPFTEIKPEISDAIGEISNIILGNAKSEFTSYGVEMTLPKILSLGQTIDQPAGSVSMLITFGTPMGKFFLEIIAHPRK